MGDTLSKVQSGDPLVVPAQAYNAFIDAAKDFQQRTRHVGQQATPGYRSASIVLVKNESGVDRSRFDVLGIDSPSIAPVDNEIAFKNRVALAGVTPEGEGHFGRFAVLLEPVRAGALGLACVSGVCPARVYVDDEERRFADVTDGDATKLATADAGAAQILWKEAGTGTKWGLVRLGNPAGGAATIPVRLTASPGGGSYTGKEQVWDGSAWSDKPGVAEITCVNLSETTGGCTSGLDLAPEPVVLVTAISGTFFFERETNAKYKA